MGNERAGGGPPRRRDLRARQAGCPLDRMVRRWPRVPREHEVHRLPRRRAQAARQSMFNRYASNDVPALERAVEKLAALDANTTATPQRAGISARRAGRAPFTGVQISPRAPCGSPSRWGGNPIHFRSPFGVRLRASAPSLRSTASAAGSRGGGLRNDADEADREAVFGSHLVLRSAVRAADVGPAGILAEVKDLGRAEELGASNALDGGVADELGRLGHRVPSGFDLGSRESLTGGQLCLGVAQHRIGRWGLLRLAFHALFGRIRNFTVLYTKEVRIVSRHKRLPVSLDGEVMLMQTPLDYRTRPRSLRVIAPEAS